jgi:hypothetical protein
MKKIRFKRDNSFYMFNKLFDGDQSPLDDNKNFVLITW